jgi:probable F420-dependent oxidoreductase
MHIGLAIPTCKEGLSLPVQFCTPRQVVQMAVRAEQLGFHSVWGNDHITPPKYVRDDYAEAPNFNEPLITLAFCAQATTRLRIGTSVLVLPMREPVYLAKQLATLDAFSGGRLTVGVGTGSYREEFERLRPRDKALRRADLVDESLQVLRLLWQERSATFEGKHYAFDGIELAPKPVQKPLPIFMGGNNPNVVRRVAKWGQGWFPASVSEEGLKRGIDLLRGCCQELGRDPGEIAIAPQFFTGIGRTHEAGLAQFKRSRLYIHLQTLAASTLRGQDVSKLVDDNLVGSPAEIVDKIHRLKALGVSMIASMSFTSDTYQETLDDMQLFAEEILPSLSHCGGRG